MAQHTDIGQGVTCGSRSTRSSRPFVDPRPAHFSGHLSRPCRIIYKKSTSCSKPATHSDVLKGGPFRKAPMLHDWMLCNPYHWTRRAAEHCQKAVYFRNSGETLHLRMCQHLRAKDSAAVYSWLLRRVSPHIRPRLITIWKEGMYGTRKGPPYRGPSLIWEQHGPLCIPRRRPRP